MKITEQPIPPIQFRQYRNLPPHELMELYQKLLKVYHANLIELSEEMMKAANFEALLANEMKNTDSYREAYMKLVDMHRRLPKGCFKIPDRREPQLSTGDSSDKVE